ILGPRGESGGFVGSHPMAGSEKRGPAAARADLYENAICLLTPPLADAAAAGVARLADFWQALGMRTRTLDAVTHDRWVALVSHLPHAVAGCLMTAAGTQPEALVAAAGGFIDSTRIAAGDPQMWTDIFLTNKAEVLAALDAFSKQLATFRQAIAQGDEKEIRAHLEQAQKERWAFETKMKPPRRQGTKGHQE
ncbi:MAG: prephenate dehydrogenase/arogenate dehydrogenase family protein, partial [Phycisphaerae bacterium]